MLTAVDHQDKGVQDDQEDVFYDTLAEFCQRKTQDTHSLPVKLHRQMHSQRGLRGALLTRCSMDLGFQDKLGPRLGTLATEFCL